MLERGPGATGFVEVMLGHQEQMNQCRQDISKRTNQITFPAISRWRRKHKESGHFPPSVKTLPKIIHSSQTRRLETWNQFFIELLTRVNASHVPEGRFFGFIHLDIETHAGPAVGGTSLAKMG